MSLTQSPPSLVAEASWRALYPFESHSLSIDGHKYHYLDQGAGPPLLFVHGNPTWSFHWRNLIPRFQGDYRAIAPDHLGCGLSDKPAAGPYRLQDHIDRLVELIRTLDLRDITLVAQDWGGAIGLGAALAEPTRFRRFVLLNTGAFPPWFCPWRIRVCRWPLVGRLGVQGLNLFARAALRMTTNRTQLAPAVKEGYLAPYGSWAERVAIYEFVRDIPLTPEHPTYATLARIEAGLPTLGDRPIQLIWGMRDWCFTPECLEKFRAIWPQAAAHTIADAGHWVVEDATEEVAATIDAFFGRHSLEGQGG